MSKAFRVVNRGIILLSTADGAEAWGLAQKIEAIGDKPIVEVSETDASNEMLRDAETAVVVAPVAPASAVKVSPVIRGITIDEVGKARSQAAKDAAVHSGFSPKQPVYARGTLVNSTGVTNAKKFRAEHDKLPDVAAARMDLMGQITHESRSDTAVDFAHLAMGTSGALIDTLRNRKFALTDRSFKSLLTSLDIPGGSYLAETWPELRAVNFNRWIDKLKNDGKKQKLVLRTRTVPKCPIPECYAVVSPDYTAFDADRIADIALSAMPKDAKCEVSYDGTRTILDVRFHSTVQPELYVAGEYFRAGIRISTDDTGNGSIKVSSAIHQNLCLNLIILDVAKQAFGRIRHTGRENRMRTQFQDAVREAQGSIAYFLKLWGYATNEEITFESVRGCDTDDDKALASNRLDSDLFIAGLFRGMAEMELVPVKEIMIPDLLRMHHEDTSSAVTRAPITRASLVNAITRYAHTVVSDPWQGAELESAAGQLLASKERFPFQLPQ